jgi:hypothetical protein
VLGRGEAVVLEAVACCIGERDWLPFPGYY